MEAAAAFSEDGVRAGPSYRPQPFGQYAQLIFQEKADLFMQLFFQERIESSTDNAPYQFDHVTEIIAVFSP